MDCSPPGSSVHGISQARVLEWGAMPSSRGTFPTQGWKLPLLTHQAGPLPLSHLGVKFSFSLRWKFPRRGHILSICCCCSVAQSCLTLCDPNDCSTPGFPVLHRLSELAHTHVHSVGDAIQPSHPLSSPSPPAFNLSQHQGLSQ